MSNSNLIYETNGSVATVTFNRPHKRNAMTWDMYETLIKHCNTIESDTAVRVLVLRGAGAKAFVAGTDISQFKTFRSAKEGIAYEQRFDEVLERLEEVTKPIIAQVQGIATGSGLAIAAACDLRLCTPDARFGMPIARTLGNCLSPANHARLLNIIGPTHLKELVYTARLLTAADAVAVGFVNTIVAADKIDSVVRELAETIAGNAPLTIKATKEIIRHIYANRRIQSDTSWDLIGKCYASIDFREGVEAFLNKRPPQWTGT